VKQNIHLSLIILAIAAIICSFSSAADTKPPMDSATNLPVIGGTHWGLLSLTEPGEKIKDAQNPADYQFYKSGKFSILHYGGSMQGGTYTVKDGKLKMTFEGGEVYMDGNMTLKGNVLDVSDGKWLMRLRFLLQDNK